MSVNRNRTQAICEEMAKDEKLMKWIEAMTPRRAIDIFFENATPVDSPDPEEMYESAPVLNFILYSCCK